MPWTIVGVRQLANEVADIEQRISAAFRSLEEDKIRLARIQRGEWKAFLKKADEAAARREDPACFLEPLKEQGVTIPGYYVVRSSPYTLVYARETSETARPILLLHDTTRATDLNRFFSYFINGVA